MHACNLPLATHGNGCSNARYMTKADILRAGVWTELLFGVILEARIIGLF